MFHELHKKPDAGASRGACLTLLHAVCQRRIHLADHCMQTVKQIFSKVWELLKQHKMGFVSWLYIKSHFKDLSFFAIDCVVDDPFQICWSSLTSPGQFVPCSLRANVPETFSKLQSQLFRTHKLMKLITLPFYYRSTWVYFCILEQNPMPVISIESKHNKKKKRVKKICLATPYWHCLHCLSILYAQGLHWI